MVELKPNAAVKQSCVTVGDILHREGLRAREEIRADVLALEKETEGLLERLGTAGKGTGYVLRKGATKGPKGPSAPEPVKKTGRKK